MFTYKSRFTSFKLSGNNTVFDLWWKVMIFNYKTVFHGFPQSRKWTLSIWGQQNPYISTARVHKFIMTCVGSEFKDLFWSVPHPEKRPGTIYSHRVKRAEDFDDLVWTSGTDPLTRQRSSRFRKLLRHRFRDLQLYDSSYAYLFSMFTIVSGCSRSACGTYGS